MGSGLGPGGEEVPGVELLDLGGHRRFPGLDGVDRATVEGQPGDDAGMGLGDEEAGPRRDRVGVDPDGIGVQWQGPRRRLLEDVLEGRPEPLVLVPLFMGGEAAPLGRPVADEEAFLGRSSRGQVGDPCVDPSDGIEDIGAVDGDLVADEEVFGDVLLHPPAVGPFLLLGPTPVPDLPDLLGGFRRRAVDGGGFPRLLEGGCGGGAREQAREKGQQ